MKKLYNKVFILCLPIKTGGPETLHQLCGNINDNNYSEAYIVYTGKNNNIKLYQQYNVKYATKVEENENNLLIVPETMTSELCKYKKIKKCIFWLSKENFIIPRKEDHYKNYKNKYPNIPGLYFIIYLLSCIRDKRWRKYRFWSYKNDILHLYNCEYAHQYLLEKGVNENNTQYLCGPIAEEYFIQNVDLEKKENIVAYNPKKGLEFTKKLIEYVKSKNENIEFIPIQNMNVNQIIELLKKAKIYIDFGNFPGPERMPREAVTLKCCIITGRNGASDNNIDVPIPDDYKFEDKEENLEKIYLKIKDIMENYKEYLNDFEKYRNKVKNQRDLFKVNIERIMK